MNEIVTRDIGHVLHIELNRPQAKNALSIEMYRELVEAFEYLDSSDNLHVGLIYGSTSCFSAGNDLKDFMNSSVLDDSHPTVKFIKLLANFSKPIVAAVAGPAVGIGTTMLLHCDMVIAANNSKFQLPFVQLGLCPEAGSSLLLPYMAGHPRAFEYLVLGKPFNADTALDMAMINQVVEPGDVINVASQIAETLSLLPVEAVIESKRLMKLPLRQVQNASIAQELGAFSSLLKSDECQKRVSSFFNK
ncbi:enoyl-CoA hydratase-related protein [Psychrosphaera sp. 1_MG-2023]|uniref:enoyl-CoA hydratase-related protein n=1 Tax=Psychrosphaera sp. 1_MG-2023 TaxID=3062643 RepID=UPI0026E2DC58|nr:enoyl-CoA hydratase-related protein [Psychrosphaera sp. 1_MG-2023]MDO6718366.1 enoyl-CoA hydratase-related protein [Psychrosphaera sp. 1_MG-2023]